MHEPTPQVSHRGTKRMHHQDKFRGFFVCEEFVYVVKHCPYYVLRSTSILAVRGRSFTKGMRKRDSGVCGSGRRDT